MKKIILLIFLIAGSITTVFSQKTGVIVSDKDGWHKIGETKVNFKTDKDEISVVGADRFAFIKIKVTDAPINLMSFDIHFESGDIQNVTIGEEFKAAGETRTVKLDGGSERSIKKIVFMYKTEPNYKDIKAKVEVWGMKTNPDKKTAGN